MTAVTIVESANAHVHGIPGLELLRVLVAASGDTYTSSFSDITNIQATVETNLTDATSTIVVASESTAGVITFGINGTNAVVALAVWGRR